MGSIVSQFNVLLIVDGKVTRQGPYSTAIEDKDEPMQFCTWDGQLNSQALYDKDTPACKRHKERIQLSSMDSRENLVFEKRAKPLRYNHTRNGMY